MGETQHLVFNQNNLSRQDFFEPYSANSPTPNGFVRPPFLQSLADELPAYAEVPRQVGPGLKEQRHPVFDVDGFDEGGRLCAELAKSFFYGLFVAFRLTTALVALLDGLYLVFVFCFFLYESGFHVFFLLCCYIYYLLK